MAVSPEVVAVLGMSDDGSRHEPHMVCVFPEPGSNLYFLIKWFINDSPLTTTSYGAVLHPNINTTAALRPHHWSSNYSLNMNVGHCYNIYQIIHHVNHSGNQLFPYKGFISEELIYRTQGDGKLFDKRLKLYQ